MKERTSRKTWGLIAASSLLLVVAGCGSEDTAEGSASGHRLVIAQTADVRSLWANATTAQAEINVTEQVNEKLIEFTADAKGFEPRLATEWNQKDPLTLEVKLRENVTFTNGEEFNADSAKASLDIMLAADAYAAFTTAIDSVEVVDDHTIAVKSANPSDLVLMSLAMGSFQYPKDYYEEKGDDGFANAPIGTGPYVLDAWKKGVSITFNANPEYWDGAPAYSSLEFQVIPDKAAQVTALQSGEVQLVTDLPRGSANQIKDSADADLVQRPSNRIWSLGINTVAEGPLQNQDVRKALQYALDIPTLIEGPMNGFGTPLQGQITTDAFFGFDPDREATGYDPEKARELLAAAGYPDGFEVVFEYSVSHGKEIAQAIAAQLEAVGLTVKQELLESGTFLQKLSAKELSGLYMAGSLPPPDSHFMYQQYRSDFRYSYYNNPEIDALIDKEVASADKEERKATFKQMLDIFVEDPAFVAMYQGEDLYAVSNNIEGFEPRASQFLDLRALTVAGN